ncbi:MAG: hypothetical protein HOH74_09355 [Gemmatimonadetes bacterium]|nr:hypothetical protein [Gemmatimonadota bacterium]
MFLRNESRLENRAILSGNESEAELIAITKLFQDKQVDGYLELNPGNFYPSEPFSWDSKVLPVLLGLGHRPGMFRCVWHTQDADCVRTCDLDAPEIRSFSVAQAEEFTELKLQLETPAPENIEANRSNTLLTFTDRWRHYIGFEDGEPVSLSSLFMGSEFGYLAWGFTRPEHRRKGHHRAHVVARATDAFALGARAAFSVTDFGIPSSLSLQKCGFSLAYNYLMIEVKGSAEES